MRIVAFPSMGIAYVDALYREVRALGVTVAKGEWSFRWLRANLNESDVIHIHWPSFLYRGQGSPAELIKSFLRFTVLLLFMRLRSQGIYWTAHNLFPHSRARYPALDLASRLLIIAASKAIFVHGRKAATLLTDRFPRATRKCVIIPHGNWIDHYPQPDSRLKSRERLNLPIHAQVFLVFGQCKPYKNLELLIKTFTKSAQKDEILLIVGSFSDPDYFASIQKLAGLSPQVRIDAGFVPDEMVPVYFSACDALCMPYREILTSGTAMLALSFGRPVLSIDRGFLADTITPECGILVEPNDQKALSDGLMKLRLRSWDEEWIRHYASQFTFGAAAQITLDRLDRDRPPARQS